MSAPAAFTVAAPLRFRIGARTLLSLPRRLVRVGWSLDDVLAGRAHALPRSGDADGYVLTSIPESLLGGIDTRGHVAQVRQRYVRHHIDLTIGHDAWLAGLSANTRAGLRRKAKRLAAEEGFDIRAYRTPDEIAAFHALARPLSALTYQERLLDAGLPDSDAVLTLAAQADAVRAWLLFRDGAPIAYLCCGGEGEGGGSEGGGDTIRYDHVGHDPAFSDLSPGTVLHAEALRQLFADRFARFDFTEGDGQHKRQLATGGTACVDVLVLRGTMPNRIALSALAGFDGAVAWLKARARHGLAKRIGDFVRRA